MAAFAFEIKDRIDHVFHNTRARDLALFGDMAHHDDRNIPALGNGRQFVRRSANLRHAARCAINVVDPHGLD